MEAIWAQKVTAEVPVATEETGFDVVFKAWDGEECAVRSEPGETIMELGKRLELGAMEGVCGGVLEVSLVCTTCRARGALKTACFLSTQCATCHCFIEPEPSPPPLEEMSDEEDEYVPPFPMLQLSIRLICFTRFISMLVNAVMRKESSRLGCQIKVPPSLLRASISNADLRFRRLPRSLKGGAPRVGGSVCRGTRWKLSTDRKAFI